MKAKLITPSYIAIILANFLLYFGFWLLVPILPFYLKEMYSCSEGIIGIVLCCYTISALVIRPFSGFILDRFSRKPLYLVAYFLFMMIFAGYLIATTLTIFILLRIIHGFAFGTVTVGGNTLVVDIMPSERRGEGLGYYGLSNNLAMSIGPMVGLFLHDALTYTWIFVCGLIPCIIGFCLATLIKTKTKPKTENETTQPKQIIEAPRNKFDRFILIKGIPASIALMMLSIPYGATTNFVAMYVKEIGLNIPTGFFFTFMAIGMGVSRLFSGRFVDKGYVTQVISTGFYIIVFAFFLLSFCADICLLNMEWAKICIFIVPLLLGIGFGIMFPAYNSLYINLAPHNQRATATSTYLTAWDVGIGIGIVASGVIAEATSFSRVYLIGAFLCLASHIYFNLYVTPHYRKWCLNKGSKRD